MDIQKQLRESRKLMQGDPQVHDCYNHAMLCCELGDWNEATDALTRANEMLPECPIIARYLSIGLLNQGKLREGLRLFERRFEHPIPEGPPAPLGYTVGPRIRERYQKPYWDGKKNLTGKTVYVFNEGGHGDIIQNVRYLPLLRSLCAKVILECKKEVYNLLEGVEGADEVVQCGSTSQLLFFKPKENFDKIAEADYVVSLHSLMYYCDPELMTTLSFNFPYLNPKSSDNLELIRLVREHPARRKIGIVWAGKPGHGNDNRRSTLMKNFLPLKKIPGVQLFSLQKGEKFRIWEGKELNLTDGGEVLEAIDLDLQLRDFCDTASVLKELDALVCVDTSISHLAGAMNLPVWLLLPDKVWAEWRWQRDWYKSQRKVHQKTDGDWAGLLEEVSRQIIEVLK